MMVMMVLQFAQFEYCFKNSVMCTLFNLVGAFSLFSFHPFMKMSSARLIDRADTDKLDQTGFYITQLKRALHF